MYHFSCPASSAGDSQPGVDPPFLKGKVATTAGDRGVPSLAFGHASGTALQILQGGSAPVEIGVCRHSPLAMLLARLFKIYQGGWLYPYGDRGVPSLAFGHASGEALQILQGGFAPVEIGVCRHSPLVMLLARLFKMLRMPITARCTSAGSSASILAT